MVLPLKGGLWRVTHENGEPLIDLVTQEAATQFAKNWSLLHEPCDLHIYSENGKLKKIISN
jgi:hypothetical protein